MAVLCPHCRKKVFLLAARCPNCARDIASGTAIETAPKVGTFVVIGLCFAGLLWFLGKDARRSAPVTGALLHDPMPHGHAALSPKQQALADQCYDAVNAMRVVYQETLDDGEPDQVSVHAGRWAELSYASRDLLTLGVMCATFGTKQPAAIPAGEKLFIVTARDNDIVATVSPAGIDVR